MKRWCKRNKVYDEITEDEIQEIWSREDTDEGEAIRLNGKYVWEAAKRVCDFINVHEDLIHITTFGEYKEVMRKIMMVIKEAHNAERKRRWTSRKKKTEETSKRKRKAKALIAEINRGGMKKEDIVKRLEVIFGRGSGQAIAKAATTEKIVERIVEMSKADEQFEVWEKMRRESKRRQREDRRLNVFWRRNKTFPAQFGGDDETPDAEETLMFWRSINNKDVSEGWRDDESIQDVLHEVREKLQRRRCRWDDFTEEEFDDVLRCTAPWKACGVDSVYSFPIKKCPPIRKGCVRAGEEIGWVEGHRQVGRGEQMAPRRAHGPHLQGRRLEGSGELPPDHVPPNHHQDGDARHPQEDEAMALWQRREEHPGLRAERRPNVAGMQGGGD